MEEIEEKDEIEKKEEIRRKMKYYIMTTHLNIN